MKILSKPPDGESDFVVSSTGASVVGAIVVWATVVGAIVVGAWDVGASVFGGASVGHSGSEGTKYEKEEK